VPYTHIILLIIDDRRDIIDYEPATGNVKKMILGSLSSMWDDGGPTTLASEGSQSDAGQDGLYRLTSRLSITSPAQLQGSRSPMAGGEPSSVANAQLPFGTDYNPERDTELSGTQFDEKSPKSPRSPPGTPASVPRIAVDSGIPSRQRSTRKATANTVSHGVPRRG
jgi:hypothetical protein